MGADLKQAFDGVRVVDFSWYAVGPRTAGYLAEHGAEVVRVESSVNPDGLRRSGPFKDGVNGPNRSGYFNNQNPNKYGVSLNLKLPGALEIARKLIARADVVLEAFTPGVMERFGLGYDELRKLKPDIVMISMGAQGRGGPFSNHSAFGHVQQALCGVNHLTGWPDGYPTGVHGPYTDFFVPHIAAATVIAALAYRRRTGKGQYIELSQLESAIHCLGTAILDYSANGREEGREGNRHPQAAPHGTYRCLGDDRWCAIAVFTEDEWCSFCGAVGNPDWTRDPRFQSLESRQQNVDALDALVDAWTSQRKAEDVMELLQAAGVAAGVVQDARDLHADPQLKHRGHYAVLDHPETGPATYDSPAYKLSRTPARFHMPAPCLGEHNQFICSELLGISDERFVELLEEGVFE
jgi:crotonobetainyl-CoA:carnitine CoA-transferase CaiB-like acyl-CoA transferase